MSVFSNLKGVMGAVFEPGGPLGPVLKAIDATHLAARNAADAVFVNMQAADAVVADDLVTLRQLNANLGGDVRMIRYAVTTTASTASASQVPATAIVIQTRVNVTTPYTAGGTISTAVGAVNVQATADVNPQAANLYEVDQETPIVTGAVATTTIGGAPAAGAATVSVFYAIPQL